MQKKVLIPAIIIIAIALMLMGLGVGFLIYNNDISNKNVNVNSNVNLNKNTNINTNTNASNQNINTEPLNKNVNQQTEQILPSILTEIDNLNLTNPDAVSEFHYYNAGKITEGKYQDDDLILLSAQPQGPSFYPVFFRFAKKDNKIILLATQSDSVEYLNTTKFTTDSDTILANLNYPEYLNGPKDRETLKLDSYANAIFSTDGLIKIFTDAKYGDVYTTDQNSDLATGIFSENGFYLEAPDGTAKVYSLQIDFFDNDTNQIPQITWSDGTKNHEKYTFSDIGGCGPQNYASVVTDSQTNLTKIGTNNRGDEIYAYQDINNAALQSMYNDEYYTIDGSQKMSYTDFISHHPIIFWHDPFNRLIKAQSDIFNPPVECGKPVIYLYPKTQQQISVKLDPVAGLSISDPAYNNGWNVIADPDGNLFDLGSQKNYPYLFWEGRSQNLYRTPDKGFVVEKNNIHNFLVDSLTKYNLNEKEIADFCAYWEPNMQTAPYYFITFLGTSQMNQLAPLNINPQPDTLIRVFMDFKPLQQPITANGYEIKSLPRTGFTVIEWGGTKK